MNSSRLKESSLITSFFEQTEETAFRNETRNAALLAAKNKIRFFSVSFRIHQVDPLAVLEQHAHTAGFEYFWEKPSNRFAMAAAGELARVQATGPTRFKESSTLGKRIFNSVYHFAASSHPQAKLHLLGGFSFFDHNISKQWKDFGAASFTLPEWIVTRDRDDHLLTLIFKITDTDTSDSIAERFFERLHELATVTDAGRYEIETDFEHSFSPVVPDADSEAHHRWIQMILEAKAHIVEQAYSKIVLAREVAVLLQKQPSATRTLNYLRHQYPDCYTFMIRQNEDSCFLGSTPERLAYFNGDELLTEGLAGSSPRGTTASEDAKLEYELLHSQKNLNEHNFVLEAISEDLVPFSDNVVINPRPTVKKLNNVLHLHTPIKAKISGTVSKTDVLKTLHPTPAVGGYPRKESKPYINRLEGFDRGWYAAPFGWITAGAEAEFIVAIRSALIKKDEVRFFAGCGIVEGSDPEKEWEETNIKLIPMLSALGYAKK